MRRRWSRWCATAAAAVAIAVTTAAALALLAAVLFLLVVSMAAFFFLVLLLLVLVRLVLLAVGLRHASRMLDGSMPRVKMAAGVGVGQSGSFSKVMFASL